MIEFRKYQLKIAQKLLFEVSDWKIEAGNIYFLLGKNGCGKSTFLRSLLQPNDTDTLRIDGKAMRQWHPKELAQKIAYVSSKLPQNDYTTVFDFLLLGRYPYGMSLFGASETARQRVAETLELLHIGDLGERFLTQLSDGQQQLVAIGRALVQEVEYLLLDEPTAFLDYLNKRKLWALIGQICKERKIAIVVVTHDLESASDLMQNISYVDVRQKKLVTLVTREQFPTEELLVEIYGE